MFACPSLFLSSGFELSCLRCVMVCPDLSSPSAAHAVPAGTAASVVPVAAASATAAAVSPVAAVKPSRRYTGHLFKQGGGTSLFGKKNWKVPRQRALLALPAVCLAPSGAM
jgi:hypothetical protein